MSPCDANTIITIYSNVDDYLRVIWGQYWDREAMGAGENADYDALIEDRISCMNKGFILADF